MNTNIDSILQYPGILLSPTDTTGPTSQALGPPKRVKSQRPWKPTLFIWDLVLYWKILFGEQKFATLTKHFLFDKLTYKSPSYDATPFASIRPSSFQLDLNIVSQKVRAPFFRKMSEKVILPVNTAQNLMKKRRAWWLTFWRVFKKAHGLKGVFNSDSKFFLTNAECLLFQ